MNGAGNMVEGVCPATFTPRRGLEAVRVRMNMSTKRRRFRSDLSDGHIAKRRVERELSLQAVRISQGSAFECGGSKVRP